MVGNLPREEIVWQVKSGLSREGVGNAKASQGCVAAAQERRPLRDNAIRCAIIGDGDSARYSFTE